MKNGIVSFGEIMLRLTPPGKVLIKNAQSFSASYGGSESNVLVALAALGHDTEYLTVLPENSLGDAALCHLARLGVGTKYIKCRGSVLGSYFLEEGFGGRGSSVIYNRRGSEVSQSNGELYNEAELCEIFDGCRLFHISGISFGISDGARELSYKLVCEARRRGITVSFDMNYRAKVWGAYPAEEYRRISAMSDIVLCSGRDLEAIGVGAEELMLEGETKYLISREKSATPDGGICAEATMYIKNGESITSETSEKRSFAVLEGIGGGDAFDAGILHGLLAEMPARETLELALSLYELKHTVVGDVISVSLPALEAFIKNRAGGSGVSR